MTKPDQSETQSVLSALRESERKLAQAQRIAHLGYWEYDFDADRLTLSDEACRILGIPMQSDQTLAEFQKLVHPEDRAIQSKAVAKALEGPGPYDVEFRVLRPDGEVRFIHSVDDLVRDGAGQARRAFGVLQDITERRRAETTLRKSERILREAEELAHTGSFEHDLITDEVFSSRENLRLFFDNDFSKGTRPEDYIQAVHPDDRSWVAQNRTQLLFQGGPRDIEHRVVWPDGSVRVLFGRAIVVRDEMDRPSRVYGINVDITERKRAEEALRETTAKLNEAQRIAHIGHWEHDLENDVITASDETYRIFGLEPREDLKTWAGWQVHLHPEDRDIRERVISGALLDGSRYEMEYRIVRPTGEVRVVCSQGEITRDSAGKPRRLFGILQDITDLRRTQDALTLFRALIDHTNDAIEILDPETGRFLDVNEKACTAHGFTRKEYLALRAQDFDPTLDAPGAWAREVEYLRKNGFRVLELQHRRKDGSVFPVEINVTYIRLDRDYMLAVVRDITERKQLENQFLQAQKMEAVGHLAGGVAHDFNNLLTIINGYSDMIQTQLPADSPLRKMVREIGQAGERAASLTRQLLAFSRKQVLEPKVLNLNSVVTDAAKMLQRLLGEDIELNTVLEPGLGRVKADPGQIEQVLMNLAVNARDAMPQGGKLTIETANTDLDESYTQAYPELRPGRYVLLAVSDTGIGMDEATMSRVFEPFFTTKGPGKGTGLGLATVHGIIKQSQGHVAVYSEPGRGATFKIYLPVVEEVISSGKSQPGLKAAPHGNETILLAEDEPALRALARHVLQMHGYTVLEASQSDKALRIAEDHQGSIHLLVTDVVMPVMSGRQLAERLAAVRPGMKVLYLSGYTDDAVVRHGVLQAETAFLQKPFTPSTLAAKVREVLDQQGG